MAIAPTQTDYDLIQLKNRNTRVKVEVLNFKFQTISSFEGIPIKIDTNLKADEFKIKVN